MSRCKALILAWLFALQIAPMAYAQAPIASHDFSKPVLLRSPNPADQGMVATNSVIGEPNKVAIKKAPVRGIDPNLLKMTPGQRRDALLKRQSAATVLLEGHEKPIVSIAWSKDGKRIATGSRDGTARIWDPATGKQEYRLENESPVVLLAFTPNGKQLLTGPGIANLSDIHESLRKNTPLNTSGKIILWDAATGKKVKVFDAGQTELLSVAISPKSDFVVGAGRDKSLCVWSIDKVEIVHKWELDVPLVQVRFTPDGNVLGAGFDEKVVRVFNPATRKELPPFKGMQGPVFGFALSTDGKHVLATCAAKFSTPLDEKNAFERTVVGAATLGISEIANAFQTKNETPTTLWHVPTREVRFQGPGKDFGALKMTQFGFDFFEVFNATR